MCVGGGGGGGNFRRGWILFVIYSFFATWLHFFRFFCLYEFFCSPGSTPLSIMVRPLESIVRISVRIQDCCAVVRAIAFPEPVLGSVRATDSILTPLERIGIQSTLFVYSSTYH